MPRKKVAKKKKRRNYSDRFKEQTIVAYHAIGFMRETARQRGIPVPTLQTWMKTDWWHEGLEQVRMLAEDRIESELDKIIELAHGRVIDSLTEGDEKLVVDPLSKLHVKKKVMPSGKDAAVMAAVAFDKRQITLNKPTSITASSDKQIQSLISDFRKLSQSYNEKKVNSIEAEYEEVE